MMIHPKVKNGIKYYWKGKERTMGIGLVGGVKCSEQRHIGQVYWGEKHLVFQPFFA
jgi:hypothetical protein